MSWSKLWSVVSEFKIKLAHPDGKPENLTITIRAGEVKGWSMSSAECIVIQARSANLPTRATTHQHRRQYHHGSVCHSSQGLSTQDSRSLLVTAIGCHFCGRTNPGH